MNNQKLTETVLNFCNSLELIFNSFLDEFLDNLTIMSNRERDIYQNSFTNDEIYEQIAPKGEKRIVNNPEKRWEFIYHDWKVRLALFIQSRTKKTDGKIDYLISKINDQVEILLSQTIDEGHPYIAEATGFFSWNYMYNSQSPGDKQKFFGSCITYTLVEHYLLSRLHSNINNVRVSLQFEDYNKNLLENKHQFWINTQNYLRDRFTVGGKFIGVSHWVTNVINYKQEEKLYRYGGDKYYLHKPFSMLDDRKNYFRALIYPVVDSYVKYWEINQKKYGGVIDNYEFKFLNEKAEKIIKDFENVIK